jgi:hypothetical protein
MSYRNPFIQIEMKFILTIFFLFTSAISLYCQDKGYTFHNEYTTDSTGKSVMQKGLKYKQIIKNGVYGLIDTAGNFVIPLGKYSFLNPMDEQGMILAKKNGKWGFIDINENVLIPFIYDDLGVFSKSVDLDLAPAAKNKKQGFINRKGETVIPFEYDYASYVRYFYEPGIAVLLKNGKYGVISEENKIIIPFVYSQIDFDTDIEFIIVRQQEKWACFSTTGEQLSDFNNFKIVNKSPLGYLPEDSKNLPILVTTKETEKRLATLENTTYYLNAKKRQKEIMLAQEGANFAFLDKNHNFIVPFGKYDYADAFGLGRKAIVANKGKYGIIDEYGKLVLPMEYDFIEQPYNNNNYAKVFLATKQNTVIIFDEKLNVIPTKGFVSYLSWRGNIFVTNKENKIGLIDYNGNQTVPCLYDTLDSEWYVPRIPGFIARKDNCYGFISRKNEILQPFKYNFIYAITHGNVYVDQNNKAGMLGEDGKIKIPFEYDAIYSTWYDNHLTNEFPSDMDIFIVEKDGKIGTIDDKNNVIIPIIYDGLSGWVEYGPEAHFVKDNGKYGIISHKGKIIIPIEYDYVGLPQQGLIEVRKNGKYGVVSWKNKEILPCIYDRLFLDIPWFVFDDEKQKSKIVVLQQNIWKYYDLNGKLLQSNVPLKEIKDKYNLDWYEPSNESHDFDMILKGGLTINKDEIPTSKK